MITNREGASIPSILSNTIRLALNVYFLYWSTSRIVNMKSFLPYLFFVLGFISCRKDADNDNDATNLDFRAVEKVLNDSVPIRFDGKVFAVITLNGNPVYTKSMGGYTADTRQLIASCSKWISAAVVMSLVDEGKFKLSDSVGKFLPIFTANGKGHITIAQLFAHTSGFPGNSQQGYENNFFISLAQAVDLIAQNVPLINPPGSAFLYGGVSMQVAGRICEVVSGKSWATLVGENVTEPCGMTDTDYGIGPNPLIGGGARSTPNDYIKLLIMLMRKGVAGNGKRVLSEAAVEAMEQDHVKGAAISYSPYQASLIAPAGLYGIGNWRDVIGANGVLIENSSPGAFGSHPWINRGKNVAGFIFTFVPANGYLSTALTCLKVRELVRDIVP